jgi:hypothetical protein
MTIKSNDIEELDRTIQSGLLGVRISVDNLNETMKAVLKILKEM